MLKSSRTSRTPCSRQSRNASAQSLTRGQATRKILLLMAQTQNSSPLWGFLAAGTAIISISRRMPRRGRRHRTPTRRRRQQKSLPNSRRTPTSSMQSSPTPRICRGTPKSSRSISSRKQRRQKPRRSRKSSITPRCLLRQIRASTPPNRLPLSAHSTGSTRRRFRSCRRRRTSTSLISSLCLTRRRCR